MDTEIQFGNRRSFPVHAEYGCDGEWQSTQIDFSDYARMQTTSHTVAPNRRIAMPSWAVNDSEFRELLVLFLEERAHPASAGSHTGTLAERFTNAQKKLVENCSKHHIPTIKGLCAELVALKNAAPLTNDAKRRIRRIELQIENLDTRLRFEMKDGGAALVVGAVYYYYRLGMDSVGAAKELGTKPPHIRQICWRLRETWKRLERWRLDPTTRPVPKAPKPTRIPKPKLPPVDVARAAELRQQQVSIDEIARQLGASSNRVMKALIKAGIYKPLAPKVKLSKRQLWAVKRHEVARKHHVGIAQRLAKLNGGMIPTTVWLRANCHLDTLEYMRRYPDFFAHLSRARFCKAKNPLFDAEKAVALYCANVSVPDIAVSFGYSRQTGNNRIINALKRAGVYRAKEKPGHGSPAGADCGADSANVSGRIIQPNNLAVLDQNEKQGEADFGSAG